MNKPNRPIRICGASGSVMDRRPIFGHAVRAPDKIDLVLGDWMSEGNMCAAAGRKVSGTPGYEATFLDVIEPVLPMLAEKGIKVAVNAGATDTELLYQTVTHMVQKANLGLKTAWISGDEVMGQLEQRLKEGDLTLKNVYTDEQLDKWVYEPIYAQAYLGSFGVAKALQEGADIVICGRVADASLCMGAAIWWHDWKGDDLSELAAALIAGHLVECSTYVTGANFSGFKTILGNVEPGLPIIEIGSKGELLLTKQENTGGSVTVDTVKAQLLYEIQGPWYYNSDVTAVIDDITIEAAGKDRVSISKVVGLPPPPTTKVGITAAAGFAGELHWAVVGLDVEEKCALFEKQYRLTLGEERISKLSTLNFTINGVAAANPRSQNSATVDFRIFAQSADPDAFSFVNFVRPAWELIMCSYPGATPHRANATSSIPRPWYEYFVTAIPQSDVEQTVHLSDGRLIPIPGPSVTKVYPSQQPSYDPTEVADLNAYGQTVDGPLGWIVHARSGDKGCNANVGFFVRHMDEWDWLRTIFTIDRMKDLLGDEYKGKKIDRFELPAIWAVHFLCHQHLDRGTNASSTYDVLGKNLAEYLRAKWLPIPKRFLDRGKI